MIKKFTLIVILSSLTLSLFAQKTKVVAWGDNSYGQCNIPNGLSSIVEIAAGLFHSMALKTDGTVVAWGENGNEQTTIPNGLASVVGIAAGYYHSLALRTDGTVVAWGNNGNGQTTIPLGLSSVVGIAAGYFHSMALKTDGTVVAWGENGNGQTTIPNGLASVVGIAAGYSHSMALKSDGTVVAWGENSNGQTTIPLGLSSVVGIAAGYSHSMALKMDGTIVAWGNNGNEQTTIPVGLYSVVGIAAGAINSMALKSDGAIVVWGDNRQGQNNVPSDLGKVIKIAQGSSANHVMVLVELKEQTITGLNIPQTITFGSTPIPLPSTATSGLPISYVANGTGAIISNNILYFIGKGVATITSSQIGNNTYSAAETIVNVVSITGFQESVNAVNTINGALLSSLAGLNAQITSLLGIINQVSTVNSSFQTQLDALLATNAQLTSLLGVGTNLANTLSTNPTEMQVQNFASNYVVNIQTNCKWQVTNTDANWLSISPTSGTGNSFINITTETNALATNRVATLSISGCTTLLSTFTVTQKVHPLSIEESNTLKTKIYPNPVTEGVFTIENAEIGIIIDVYNAQGNIVYTHKTTSSSTILNTNLPKGMYVVKMGATFIEKVIVE